MGVLSAEDHGLRKTAVDGIQGLRQKFEVVVGGDRHIDDAMRPSSSTPRIVSRRANVVTPNSLALLAPEGGGQSSWERGGALDRA